MRKKALLVGLVWCISIFSQQKPKILYVADPLCSWCYGFQTEVEKVLEKYNEKCNFELLVGGMGVENTKPLSSEFKESILGHWEDVNQESGQPFNPQILKTNGLIYNSEPLCRAIITVKSIDSTKALKMHKTLQNAFYAQGRNVTQLDEIIKCVSELGLDTAKFANMYVSNEMIQKTQAEFERVERNGITGFPVLILIKDDKTILITEGYAKFKKLQKKLKRHLKF